MDINSIHGINKALEADNESFDDDSITNDFDKLLSDAQTKQAIDQATGLLQTILSEKISDNVIQKMPSDDHQHLITLLDEIISGSIDKKV